MLTYKYEYDTNKSDFWFKSLLPRVTGDEDIKVVRATGEENKLRSRIKLSMYYIIL